MALIPSPVSPGAGYTRRLDQLFAEADRFSEAGGMGTREFNISQPIQSWLVPRSQVAAGKILSAAAHTQWLTLRERQHGAWHVGEIPLPEGGGRDERRDWRGGIYYRGEFGSLIVSAANHLARPEVLPDGDYVLRLLRVIGMRFLALWVSGPRDLLYPLNDYYWDGQKGLPVAQLMDEARVRAILRPLALRAAGLQGDETN